jgi:uncharacterized BrkB/YihY/UPF0761 family membrane protein
MRSAQVKRALWRTYNDVQNKHTMQMAAGLSYFICGGQLRLDLPC